MFSLNTETIPSAFLSGLPSRTTKLPRIKPPDLACPRRGDAVLVASVHSVCHAVQAQQALPRLCFPPVTPGMAPGESSHSAIYTGEF